MVTLSTQQTNFNFHPKYKALGVSHLTFADDILHLCRCDISSVSILYQQLLSFGRMSGLDDNAAKSSIFLWDRGGH